jgi:hypothetical protein
MDTRNHVHNTQQALDSVDEAVRDADDALVEVLGAVQEGDDAGQYIGQLNDALACAEDRLRVVKSMVAQLTTPREATAQ